MLKFRPRQLKNELPRNVTATRPSMPALALATRLCNTMDVYVMAEMIDSTFMDALERVRREERDRIFNLGVVDLMREFWTGRKIRLKPGQKL